MQLAARLGLVAIGIVVAIYMGRGRFPIGLDYQGGASLELTSGPPGHAEDLARIARDDGWTTLVDGNRVRMERDGATDADIDRFLATARTTGAQAPTVEYRFAIEADGPRWQVEPLVIAIAVVSILAWLATFRSRRTWVAMLGAATLGWATTVAFMLHAGGTYSRTLWFSGLVWVVPLAMVAAFAARAPVELGKRLVAVWPAGVALAVAFVIPNLVVVFYKSGAMSSWHLVMVGIKHAVIAVPAIAVLVGLTIGATPPRVIERSIA